MTLGCKIRPHLRQTLKKYFTRVDLPPEGDEQMERALIGPKLYKSGEPYIFDYEGLEESKYLARPGDKKPSPGGFTMLNVMCGGIWGTPPRKSARQVEDIKAVGKGAFGTDRCAGCGDKQCDEGTPLVVCSACKGTMYCGKVCQKQHWKMHKGVCVKKVDEEKNVDKGGAVQAAA
jgi:hypothetical protein